VTTRYTRIKRTAVAVRRPGASRDPLSQYMTWVASAERAAPVIETDVAHEKERQKR